jgi:hypothetical protein
VAYAGRSIDGEPRYKLPGGFGKGQELYNLHRAIETEQKGFIGVEGYCDCMKVHQAGYPFVVALMGCLTEPPPSQTGLRFSSTASPSHSSFQALPMLGCINSTS